MRHLLKVLIFAFISALIVSQPALAVGELLGLNVEITLSDGTTVMGKVVGETETSIRVEDSGTVVVVDREMIVAISLLEDPGIETERTLSGSSEFQDVQREALRKSAIWSLGRDSISVAQTLVLANCVRDPQAVCNTGSIVTYVVFALGSIAWDLFTKPSLEERLFWQSRLPGWYGILNFAEGLVGLGASVSVVVGVVQDQIASPSIAPAQVWYERSAMLYIVKAGLRAIKVLYDASVIASPATQ